MVPNKTASAYNIGRSLNTAAFSLVALPLGLVAVELGARDVAVPVVAPVAEVLAASLPVDVGSAV